MQVIFKELTKASQMWEELLSTSGGKLEISKRAIYTIRYRFDNQGIPYLHNNNKDAITISLSEINIQQTIPHLSNNINFEYLGVNPALNGNQDIQCKNSLSIVKKVTKNVHQMPISIHKLRYILMHMSLKKKILFQAYHYPPNNILNLTNYTSLSSSPQLVTIERGLSLSVTEVVIMTAFK